MPSPHDDQIFSQPEASDLSEAAQQDAKINKRGRGLGQVIFGYFESKTM
jgi:hypothetical protein